MIDSAEEEQVSWLERPVGHVPAINSVGALTPPASGAAT